MWMTSSGFHACHRKSDMLSNSPYLSRYADFCGALWKVPTTRPFPQNLALHEPREPDGHYSLARICRSRAKTPKNRYLRVSYEDSYRGRIRSRMHSDFLNICGVHPKLMFSIHSLVTCSHAVMESITRVALTYGQACAHFLYSLFHISLILLNCIINRRIVFTDFFNTSTKVSHNGLVCWIHSGGKFNYV
jgi:hypothetical protein